MYDTRKLPEMTKLAAIAEMTDASFEASRPRSGQSVFWRSETQLRKAKKYQTPPLKGLHIGAGIANINWSGANVGTVSANGPCVVALYPGTEPATITTEVFPGRAVSCGYFVQESDLPSHLMDAVALIKRQLRQTKSRGAPGKSSEIEVLCRPFSPFHVGDALAFMEDARAFSLIAMVAGEFSQQDLFPEHAGLRAARYARQAADIIETNLASPPKLADLSQQVGLNARSLSEAFKQTFGVSIGAYVAERRMELALGLLESGMAVSQAAYKIGYTPTAFSTAFRRHYSRSPSDVNKSEG